MKKKLIYIIIGVCIILLGGGYIYLDTTTYKVLNTDVDMPIYHSVAELEYESDLVVKVKFTGESKNHVEKDSDGIPLWYWNDSTVKIQKVISSTDQIKSGDEIVIVEPFGVFDNKIGKAEIKPTEYQKMKKGNSYVFFLKQREDGKYMPIGVYQGKINLDEESPYNKKLNKLVKEKYADEIK